MLERSAAYDAAIVGSPRQILLRAVADISDPDKVWLPVTDSGAAPWSRGAELRDRNFDQPPRAATLEPGRWLLGGGFEIFPDGYRVPGDRPQGWASEALSGKDGTFNPPVWVSLNFQGMSILQAFSLFFSTDPLDGTPEDFTVEVLENGTAYFTRSVTGNRETEMWFDGFTVHNPTAIRVTVTKWSLPGRRVRMVEIVPGIYEDWDADELSAFTVTQQGQFSCLSLPYGRAEIAMDNHDRRFEPRRKDGIFQSIQERQGVELHIGVRLPDGVEYKELGMYYQAGDGWKTGGNAMDMKWSLVDIIGLLAERTFLPPDPLPETLEGWLQALVGQLGEAFRRRYRVDPAYAKRPVAAGSREAVTGKKCGDILRWVCQASGTWPRADSATGALTAEPLWNQGAKLDLDNLSGYPIMKANESLAALIFRLSDGTETVIPGNAASSERTVTIVNPFLHTREQAQAAARLILSQYGGNIIETTGRGNPASEIGDVDTIWLDESSAATARRMAQTFEIRDGALQGCRSTLLQADGSYLWTEFEVLDQEEGDWTAPEGVTDFRLVLSDGGQGGGVGQEGQKTGAGNSNISFSGFHTAYGEQGVDGKGGRVWFGTIKLNPGATVHYKRGAGGAPGSVYGEAGGLGQPSTFGAYSSAEGQLYPDGYTDIANGRAFCRPGVEVPLPGSGDGGKGGDGGEPPEGYLAFVPAFKPTENHPGHYTWRETKPAGPGKPGAAGASGFIMLSWERPEEERHGR